MEKYGRRLLWVDLTNQKIEIETLSTKFVDDFLGGWGVQIKLAYDLIKPGITAFNSEIPIIISPGVLTGTLCPGTSKVFMTTKCPISNTISTSVGSLHFGFRLKWAGWDHLIITGRAQNPAYLKIIDDQVELCDAEKIWGRDLFEATDWLKDKYGYDSSVLAIGPAGENLVKIAIALIDKGSTCGRSFGSVMGYKNLKAIIIKGSKGVNVAKAEDFSQIIDRLVQKGMQDPMREKWKKYALHNVLPYWLDAGYIPTRNYKETVKKEEFLSLYGPEAYMKVYKRTYGCPSCLAPDKAVLKYGNKDIEEYISPFSTPMVPMSCFGARTNVGSIEKAIKCGDIAGRYGIDILTFTSLFGFMVDLYSRGIISTSDTDGIELKDDFETVVNVMSLVTQRKGIGNILAEGFPNTIATIGRDCEKYAMLIKGTDVDFDARVSLGLESFTAVTNPRPSNDLPIGGLTIAQGRKPEFFIKVVSKIGYVPNEAMDKIFTSSGFDLPRLAVYYENWASVLNIMGICFRMQVSSLYDVNSCALLYSAATGIEKAPKQILEAGERAFNVYKSANVREGYSRKDDKFPDRWFEPLKHSDKEINLVMKDYFGTKIITKEDSEKMLDTYYEERGWNVEKGVPSVTKLKKLKLEDIANELIRLGLIKE